MHRFALTVLLIVVAPTLALADMDPNEAMARKLANPLATIHALMTENTVNYGAAGGVDNYNFQVQPVWAFDAPALNGSIVPRAVIPINGRKLGPGDSHDWGIGDTIAQLYFAPSVDSAWKWGFGPQFSFNTASKAGLGGLGNGIGLAGIVVGDITPQLAFAGIAFNHWSYDGSVSFLNLQPMFYYNFPSPAGMYLMYNQPWNINWKADGDSVTIPLGLGLGQSWGFDGGWGLDVNLGAYGYPVAAAGTPDWTLKFGVSVIFP